MQVGSESDLGRSQNAMCARSVSSDAVIGAPVRVGGARWVSQPSSRCSGTSALTLGPATPTPWKASPGSSVTRRWTPSTSPGQHVADVGCGPGLTTIELGRRVAPSGTATGVDVSARMIETATARAMTTDGRNVAFVVGDPGVGSIGSFDAIYSRFGVMCFGEPATAFSNIAQSIRPGERFVAVVWAELDANPWMFVPTLFAAGPLDAELTLPGPGEPGPFSLADPAQTVPLLESSGFCEVDLVSCNGVSSHIC